MKLLALSAAVALVAGALISGAMVLAGSPVDQAVGVGGVIAMVGIARSATDWLAVFAPIRRRELYHELQGGPFVGEDPRRGT